MTDYNIDKLLEQLEWHPNDDKLLAIIALYYIENPEGNKDIEYLERAYQTNPSIENTHNLAFWSMYEHGENERSLKLQKQVLEQNPSSYYPYASYAQMLQSDMLFSRNSTSFKSNKQAQEYIRCLVMAAEKFLDTSVEYQQRYLIHLVQIYNSLAYAYKVLKDDKKAFSYLMQCIKIQEGMNTDDWNSLEFQALFEEEMNKVRLNIVRILIASKHSEEAKSVLAEIAQTETYDELDVAVAYARLGEYQLVNEMIGDDVPSESWDWIWYAIYHVDYDKWCKTRKLLLKEEEEMVEEFLVRAEQSFLKDDLDSYESECESIENSRHVIKKISFMLEKDNQPVPKEIFQPDFENSFFGCLLFGCHVHGNLMDDTMAISAQE